MANLPSAAKIAMPADVPASNSPRQYSIVVAVDQGLGIGKAGSIPWRSSEDMAFFKDLTTKAPKGRMNAVVMGVKTYASIPPAFRPLAGRLNIVLVPDAARPLPEELTPDSEGLLVVFRGTLEELLVGLGATQPPPSLVGAAKVVDRIFIGGGATLYEEAFFNPSVRRLLQAAFITRVAGFHECDAAVKLPAGVADLAHGLTLEARTRGSPDAKTQVAFEVWTTGNPEEAQYLALCKQIIETGSKKGDRTGTGTVSIFGGQMRFSLRDGAFPLLTTKRVFYRGIVEELLWFLRGDTDALHLSEKGVHIWDANGSREFLDGRGLKDNRVGDLGPVYGFQWRHFGAEYATCDDDYTGKGVDQIREVIHTLRTNPNDRRMIVTAWNPAALSKMALPPCHMFAQFYVNDRQELSCMLYQRSCDMGLGVPFNIASYALLTVMIALAAGLKLGEFVHTLGDAHVYLNHVDAVTEQLLRNPRAFPKLVIKKHRDFLEDFVADDFELRDYFPYPSIKMDMAV